jgi:hypothetical protein
MSGTATNGTDYISISSPRTIAAGTSFVDVTLTPLNDTSLEGNEIAILTLLTNPAYDIDPPGSAVITIADVPPEIILDNAAAGVSGEGRSFTGTWAASSAAGFYGVNSLYSNGSGIDTYRWTPTISTAGSYDVYVRWTAYSTRSTTVPIAVTHAGGTTSKNFNQQAGGGVWVLHGTYNFNAGTGGYVQVSESAPTGAQACADAVKFVPATTTLPDVTIAIPDATAAENPLDMGTFNIRRSGSTSAAITVNYSVSGTASPGEDFTVLSGSVTIPAGSQSGAIIVTPIDDSGVEIPETVTITLSASPAYTVGSPASASITIKSEDEIILDNAATGVSGGGRTYTGTWAASSAAGFYGVNSLYSNGTGTDTYRWTPTIPIAGSYEVYVRWTAYSTRSTAVPIAVTHAGGTTSKTYNQQTGGGVWVLHGSYNFNAGTAGYVQVSDVNGQACADAVRFVPVQ